LSETLPNPPTAGYNGNACFWNIDYYRHHFDVDTKIVVFLSNSIDPPLPPLTFMLFVMSSLAHTIASYLSLDLVK
jgi:hypothetical protein